MKIAINLRLLNPGKIGGMEVYVRNLLEYFIEIDHELELILFVTKQNEETFHFPADRVTKIHVSRVGYGHQIFRALLEHSVDLYFCPLIALEPVVVHIPTIVTIPDVQHDIFPEFFQQNILQWRRLNYSASASIATAVLTLSRFSAQSITEKMGTPPQKVFPVHLAADDSFRKEPDKEKEEVVKKKYSLPNVYGYFPANSWPHKNHATLLKALTLFKHKYGAAPKIILTGAKDTGHKDLLRKIKDQGLTDDVMFLGYIPKNEIRYIYRNATFLVFPSLFEGFGMPVLEAMLSGCPVICSNTTSLPEVAGGAALYFDPLNAEDLAEKINTVISDSELRERLIKEGYAQALEFSWEQTAKNTLKIFKGLLRQESAHTPEQPLVSIVTPSYNQGNYIEETILSVLGQDYPNVEYTVIDGGSKDQTVNILKKYDKKIKWLSEHDKGQADAVNKGFRVAKGEILGWLNSDDVYLPGAVRRAVAYFEAHPDAVMVYGNAYYTDRDSVITGIYESDHFNFGKLARHCFICQPAVFIHAAALKEVGGLDVSLETCLDYDLWIRIAKQYKGRIGFTEDYLAISRMYEENKTLSMRVVVYDEIVSTVKKHFGYVPDSWVHGYITDVINGIYMKRHSRLFFPFTKLIHFVYVVYFLFRTGNQRLLLTALLTFLQRKKNIEPNIEALSYKKRDKIKSDRPES
jgi:glycosyltransferase involved in cell wall biosynthesis